MNRKVGTAGPFIINIKKQISTLKIKHYLLTICNKSTALKIPFIKGSVKEKKIIARDPVFVVQYSTVQ